MSNTTTVPAHPTDDLPAGSKLHASFRWVTPDQARRWLDHNDRNRNLNVQRATRLADDMTAGRWMFDGATIRFAADGTLLDGQHRLTAIVLSDQTVLALIVTGLDPASQDVMDTGRRRSAADMFTIAGETDGKGLAAVARLVVSWQQGTIKHTASVPGGATSNAVIRDTVNADPSIAVAAGMASRLARKIGANPSAVGFAAWLLVNVDPVAASEFLHAVAEWRTNGVGDPRHTLLARLRTANARDERLTSIEQAFLIVRSWNAWRAGKELKVLKTHAGTADGSRPLPFPVAS